MSASYAGEVSRAVVLRGGLLALMRLAPGTSFKEEPPGTVTVSAHGRKLTIHVGEMLTDSEVAAALEGAEELAAPKLSRVEIDDAVAAAVVNALGDRHSAYLKPAFVQRLGYSEGELLGDPGVDFTLDGERMIVRTVAPGSSAASAGLAPGLVLRRVDSHNVDGLCLGELGALLLGQAGSAISLVVEKPEGGELSTVALRRDPPYALHPQIRRLGDVLHVVPGPLLGGATPAVREALQREKGVRGAILDLRGNGGGQVADAMELADLFIPRGATAVVSGRPDRPAQRFDAKPGDPGEGMPLAVILDGRTASSSELLALVLRERLNTPLWGSPSYGKGSVQKLLPIEGGGYLKITSAHFTTAKGTGVGSGIQPDHPLEPGTYPRRGQEGSLQNDAWLQAAYNALVGAKAGSGDGAAKTGP
ncbi:MAG: S41 family peptidase [Myxococcota bacterium]